MKNADFTKAEVKKWEIDFFLIEEKSTYQDSDNVFFT